MDRSLDPEAQRRIAVVLSRFEERGIRFHATRTRQGGQRAFVSTHVLVPGAWSVQQGHDLAEEVESALRASVPNATVFTHVEPADDPRSFEDTALDRSPASP
jgi:divalent metal cation (Fe/Co/Zn/Cd) transporter